MPGGLLDLMGIDPIANRQQRMQRELLERQIAGQLAQERLRGDNQLVNTRLQGDENRKTDKAKLELDKALETLKSSNLINEDTRKQILGIMAKEGVVYTPENERVFDKSLTDTRIRKALQGEQQMLQARQNPAFQQSLEQGLVAQNLAPAFQNIKTGTQGVQPGELQIMPPSGIQLPSPNLNQWNQAQGATTSEVVEETPSGIPGFPKINTLRQQTPGRVRISPDVQQRAMKIVQEPTMTNTNVVDDIRINGYIPLPQLY